MNKPVTPHEIFFPAEDPASRSGAAAEPIDRKALDELFSATYEELRRLAFLVGNRRHGQTLNPTALVNETWLKLSKTPELAQLSEVHFKRLAARAMRQVLISAARRRNAGKRAPSGPAMITFDESLGYSVAADKELIVLDDALDQLAQMNARQALIVESRFFGGLEISEIASLANVSDATVLRDWRAARAWLAHQLRSGGASEDTSGGE